jgi:hypothetical protein
MRYVTNNLALYRMSERNYRRMLRVIANDEPMSVDNFGVYLGTVDAEISRLEPDDARLKLKEG